ncbi:hypothetical protein [Herbiconiux sp.]|uniref:hypothetical protein n=1 Tax=Herbiconiux sp. TaxID=1871186 RepID=UPI0025C22163|nr:hypothetical protein [Herbiconiux sp.]
MRNEKWWTGRAHHLARIGVIAVVTGALWIPLIVFLQLPERSLLGPRGHLGVALTAMVQFVALGAGLAVAAYQPTDEFRARRRSWIWGFLAVPPALLLA